MPKQSSGCIAYPVCVDSFRGFVADARVYFDSGIHHQWLMFEIFMASLQHPSGQRGTTFIPAQAQFAVLREIFRQIFRAATATG
jgi:hypothetical protein